MSNKAKNVVVCIFIIVAVIVFVVFFLIPNIITMIAPTFFSDIDISGFNSSANTVSLLMALLSICLAVYSIYQAKQGNDEIEKILDKTNSVLTGIEIIKAQQDAMNKNLWYSHFHFNNNPPPNNPSWKNDDIFE